MYDSLGNMIGGDGDALSKPVPAVKKAAKGGPDRAKRVDPHTNCDPEADYSGNVFSTCSQPVNMGGAK